MFTTVITWLPTGWSKIPVQLQEVCCGLEWWVQWTCVILAVKISIGSDPHGYLCHQTYFMCGISSLPSEYSIFLARVHKDLQLILYYDTHDGDKEWKTLTSSMDKNPVWEDKVTVLFSVIDELYENEVHFSVHNSTLLTPCLELAESSGKCDLFLNSNLDILFGFCQCLRNKYL